MCSTVSELTGASSRSNTRAAPEAVLTIEPVLAEMPEAQLISLEDADGKTEGEQGLGDEAEELVELNDEVLDDTSLIEEREQEDAGDEIEEENDVEEGS
jgi:hypothetical protein